MKNPSLINIGDNCRIHPTAIIQKGAVIGNNNHIGPYSMIYSNAIIGNDNIFEGSNYIGVPAEHRKYNHVNLGTVIIGHSNIFYPFSRVYSPCRTELTQVGNRNYFMANSHIGHDSIIGQDCNFAPNTVTGRNVIMDRVFMGINSCIHAQVLIPEGCIIGMGSVLTKQIVLKPYSLIIGNPGKVAGLNAIGLSRSRKTDEEIDQIKENFHTNILKEL